MKRIISCRVLALGLSVGVVPLAHADMYLFPCGGTAKYTVLMPQGVLLDGKQCSGALIIDDSVKIIDDNSFESAALTSVTIGNSVIRIGNSAFMSTSLTSVTIGNSVTEIGELAFYNTKLTSVVIPNSVTNIGDSAFNNAPITSLTLGNAVTRQVLAAMHLTQPNSPH